LTSQKRYRHARSSSAAVAVTMTDFVQSARSNHNGM
jgi:hypothetical protein